MPLEWQPHPILGQFSTDKKWRVFLVGGMWTLQQQGVEGYTTSRTEEGIKAIAQTLADSGENVHDYMTARIAKGD